jgi:hypothetical protein
MEPGFQVELHGPGRVFFRALPAEHFDCSYSSTPNIVQDDLKKLPSNMVPAEARGYDKTRDQVSVIAWSGSVRESSWQRVRRAVVSPSHWFIVKIQYFAAWPDDIRGGREPVALHCLGLQVILSVLGPVQPVET